MVDFEERTPSNEYVHVARRRDHRSQLDSITGTGNLLLSLFCPSTPKDKTQIQTKISNLLISKAFRDSKAVMHRIANPFSPVRLWGAPPNKKAVTVLSNGFFIDWPLPLSIAFAFEKNAHAIQDECQ